MNAMSSSAAAATGPEAADVAGCAALAAGAGVLAGAAGVMEEDVTGRVTTPLSDATACEAATGGATRRTWPTSIRFALSRLFQRAMSFQLWPDSSPIRIRVSPGLTV